jgi:hypothetical protein
MKEISKTQIISSAELETGVASIHSRFDDYLPKEDYIEDKAKFAIKELEKENKYRIREDEVDKRLDYTLQEILSIKNYNNLSDVKSIIYFGNIKIKSDKKFSKISKWFYKKLFGWVIIDIQ